MERILRDLDTVMILRKWGFSLVFLLSLLGCNSYKNNNEIDFLTKEVVESILNEFEINSLNISILREDIDEVILRDYCDYIEHPIAKKMNCDLLSMKDNKYNKRKVFGDWDGVSLTFDENNQKYNLYISPVSKASDESMFLQYFHFQSKHLENNIVLLVSYEKRVGVLKFRSYTVPIYKKGGRPQPIAPLKSFENKDIKFL